MRKRFSELLHSRMATDPNIVVLTADLGYGLWDRIKIDYPDRFYDVGSSEQIMLGAACGMAMEGKTPFVYSITPFVLYRPFEFIRNYVDHEKISVKLIGGGRGKDYGYLGFSHWATEDTKIMKCFKNIKSFWPTKDELEESFSVWASSEFGPCYINLER